MKLLLVLLVSISAPLLTYNDKQLTSLYNGLDPQSITQHIALYKLYPNQPVGEKALKHVHELLKKCQSNRETLSHLPSFNESIDGFVFFMLGKGIQEDYLSEEYLSAIEAISSHLGNRKLKGYNAQTEEEVLALPSHEIDLGRAILLAQQEKEPDLNWLRNYEAQLDFLALQVLARLPEKPTPKEMIREINHVLFFDLKYRFPNQYIQDQHYNFSQLSAVLDNRQGVCLGTTIVYLCIAQRLNLPLEIITPPGHIYLRYNDGENITNIETTHRGVHVPSDVYYSVNVKFLKQIDLKATIAGVYLNLGTTNLMDNGYDKAVACYEKGLRYNPQDALLTLMAGFAHAFNQEPKEAKKLFQQYKNLSFDDVVTPFDLDAHKIYLNQPIELDLLKAALIPPKEQKKELLEARKELLEQGLKRHPQFIAGWSMLASIYGSLSEPKKAIDALLHIHNQNPNIAHVEFSLALLYNEELNFPASWKHFHQCEALLEHEKVDVKIMTDVKRMLLNTSLEPM